MSVIDVPEAPVLSVIAPTTPSKIFNGTTGKRIDTGYRLSATDGDGDVVRFRANEDPRFVIRNGNEVWIKSGQIFNHQTESEITLKVKAIDDSVSKLDDTKTITFYVDDKGPLNITSLGPTSVRENKANIIYTPSASLRNSPDAKIKWSLAGQDAASFRINEAGDIWFLASPNYESSKKSYTFDLVATVADGQLTHKQSVTINITDVDEKPTEMSLNKDAKTFSDKIDVKDGRKLTRIKFVDVDLDENGKVDHSGNGATINQSISQNDLLKILRKESDGRVTNNTELPEII